MQTCCGRWGSGLDERGAMQVRIQGHAECWAVTWVTRTGEELQQSYSEVDLEELRTARVDCAGWAAWRPHWVIGRSSCERWGRTWTATGWSSAVWWRSRTRS